MAVSGAAPVLAAETAYGVIETETEIAMNTEYAPQNTETVVREYFKDIPIMIQVARCESHFRHTLADGSTLRGKVDQRDMGVMQINTYYHGATATALGLDLNDLHDNLAYARYLYEKKGTQPWSASAPCWGRTLAYSG